MELNQFINHEKTILDQTSMRQENVKLRFNKWDIASADEGQKQIL